jgi:ABC-2 type transport system permease protein
MSASTIKSIINTSAREVKRMTSRPIYLFSSVFVMVFCYIFFLTLFREGLPLALPVGIVDMDHSVLSRTFTRNMDATAQTKIVNHYSNYIEAREDMQRGKIYAFIVIKDGFERDVLSNRRPHLTYYINDAYLVAGSLTFKDITLLSELNSAAVQEQVLQAKGTVDRNQILAIVQPIALDSHLLANPWTNYGVYLINVVLPAILQLLVLMLTIFSVGIELKERTSREWLRTSNNSMFAALTGKLLPYTLLFTALGIGGNLVLYKLMHFPMNGSFARFCLATFIFVIAHQAIGIFMIGLLPVLRDGISLGGVFGLLGVTFAGFVFPIEGMPYGVRIFSELFPIRHYFRIYVNEALLAADFRYSLIYYAALLAFLILPLLVYYRLKKAAVYLKYSAK